MSDTDLPDPGLPDPGPAERGLSADQDGRLRTLAALREHGVLAPELQELRRSYRERDQRAEVRPPSPVTWPALEERGGQA